MIEIQVLASFDPPKANSKTGPVKLECRGSSFPLSFQRKSLKYLLHKTKIFPRVFMFYLLQNQSFRISGRPGFPNLALEGIQFHCLYQKHIIICDAN